MRSIRNISNPVVEFKFAPFEPGSLEGELEEITYIGQFQAASPLLASTFPARTCRLVKRLLDVTASGLGLVLLSPLLALIWLAVRLDSPGPAVFKQNRVGKNGRIFTMYKFRTMVADAEKRLAQLAHLNQGGLYMIKIPNDPRVTRLGRFLRKTSLDELPQLWNVLKGEMSLVGPRPQSPHEVALYTPRQRCRLLVTPGITGLWQVTSRHVPDFDEWVTLDLNYMMEWSLALDGLILLKTVGVVLKH